MAFFCAGSAIVLTLKGPSSKTTFQGFSLMGDVGSVFSGANYQVICGPKAWSCFDLCDNYTAWGVGHLNDNAKTAVMFNYKIPRGAQGSSLTLKYRGSIVQKVNKYSYEVRPAV